MIRSFWVTPFFPLTVRPPYPDIDATRQRIEQYPAQQFASYAEAQEYAMLVQLAGLDVKIQPSQDVFDPRAYQEARDLKRVNPHKFYDISKNDGKD